MTEHPECQYVILIHVPLTIVNSHLNNPRLFGKGVRIFYREDLAKLIIKLPNRPHERARTLIEEFVWDQCRNMNLPRTLEAIGASVVSDSPYKKEPDASWIPAILPSGRTDKWPSMVLEVGYSESLRRLRVDAAWWLSRSKGDVEVVLIISIHTRRPEIIEKWKKDPRSTLPLPNRPNLRAPRRMVPERVQEIKLSASQNNVTVNGAPLVLQFSDIFLRPTRNPQEVDFTHSQQDLMAMAAAVWKVQKWPDFV
jgi:hypothetical protein